mmetsp:Transcript_12194/g.29620  ORF Transcript_12194/g.29620 Transcript_12194/m.29620 type:complete len:80 (-) Transcript_12194:948-1187(-)
MALWQQQQLCFGGSKNSLFTENYCIQHGTGTVNEYTQSIIRTPTYISVLTQVRKECLSTYPTKGRSFADTSSFDSRQLV